MVVKGKEIYQKETSDCDGKSEKKEIHVVLMGRGTGERDMWW